MDGYLSMSDVYDADEKDYQAIRNGIVSFQFIVPVGLARVVYTICDLMDISIYDFSCYAFYDVLYNELKHLVSKSEDRKQRIKELSSISDADMRFALSKMKEAGSNFSIIDKLIGADSDDESD